MSFVDLQFFQHRLRGNPTAVFLLEKDVLVCFDAGVDRKIGEEVVKTIANEIYGTGLDCCKSIGSILAEKYTELQDRECSICIAYLDENEHVWTACCGAFCILSATDDTESFYTKQSNSLGWLLDEELTLHQVPDVDGFTVLFGDWDCSEAEICHTLNDVSLPLAYFKLSGETRETGEFAGVVISTVSEIPDVEYGILEFGKDQSETIDLVVSRSDNDVQHIRRCMLCKKLKSCVALELSGKKQPYKCTRFLHVPYRNYNFKVMKGYVGFVREG